MTCLDVRCSGSGCHAPGREERQWGCGKILGEDPRCQWAGGWGAGPAHLKGRINSHFLGRLTIWSGYALGKHKSDVADLFFTLALARSFSALLDPLQRGGLLLGCSWPLLIAPGPSKQPIAESCVGTVYQAWCHVYPQRGRWQQHLRCPTASRGSDRPGHFCRGKWPASG